MSEKPLADAAHPRWRTVGWAVLVAAFAVGFVGFPMRVVGWRFDYLPGDDIDNPLNNFVLEHGYRCLSGRAESFWNVPSYYPQPRVTGWSDAHLGMLPVYAALRACGLSPERAFQGHFLIPFPLNFIAAAWALRRLGFGPFGTAAGAYVFTFGLPLVAQLIHTQLFPRFLVPPAVVFAWEYLRAPRAWRLAAVAACAVGQTYLSVYLGYFLGLLLATGFAFSAARFGRQLPWRALLTAGGRDWGKPALVVAVAAVALVPLGVGHTRGAGTPPREQAWILAPPAGAWLTPPAAAALHTHLGEATGMRAVVGERQLVPGLVALAAVAVGLALVVRPGPFGGPRAAVAVAAWSAVLPALVVTRFDDVWLYAPVTHLPGLGGIRAIGRVVLVLLFPVGVALAGGIDALVARAGRSGRAPARLAGALALALVVTDNWLTSPDGVRAGDWSRLRYPVEHIVARQALIGDAIRRRPGATLVYVFPSIAENKLEGRLVVQVEAMRAAQDLGIPCVNGWSGYLPPHWDYFRGYRGLMEWLTVQHATPERALAGLVVIGEPVPDADPQYEAAMRAAFPPRAVAPPP